MNQIAPTYIERWHHPPYHMLLTDLRSGGHWMAEVFDNGKGTVNCNILGDSSDMVAFLRNAICIMEASVLLVKFAVEEPSCADSHVQTIAVKVLPPFLAAEALVDSC
ncbi:hypothetical protein MRX96_014676 [Rhipicephalus microplus]